MSSDLRSAFKGTGFKNVYWNWWTFSFNGKDSSETILQSY